MPHGRDERQITLVGVSPAAPQSPDHRRGSPRGSYAATSGPLFVSGHVSPGQGMHWPITLDRQVKAECGGQPECGRRVIACHQPSCISRSVLDQLRCRKCFGDRIDGLLGGVGHQVAIGVDGDRQRRVAQSLRRHRQRNLRADHECGGEMRPALAAARASIASGRLHVYRAGPGSAPAVKPCDGTGNEVGTGRRRSRSRRLHHRRSKPDCGCDRPSAANDIRWFARVGCSADRCAEGTPRWARSVTSPAWPRTSPPP
jgi:hypothetical protein